MNLAILHYHLDRGGVTRVIENHLLALDAVATQPLRIAVLSGGRVDGGIGDVTRRLRRVDVRFEEIPTLDYDEREPQPEPLATAIRDTLARIGFSRDDTLLHVHNHSLGKNVSLPGAIGQFADEGWRLLLQIHDFAEDFRPANFRRLTKTLGNRYARTLYPQASHVHYAVLSGRDYDLLATTGIPADRLHFLPNPVPDPGPLPDREAARRKLERCFGVSEMQRFVLYPVRGIRRKNLGELLLLSLLDERTSAAGSVYGLALAPVNPAERPFHDRWQAFVRENSIPVRFGTGETGGLTFHENLAAADAIVTTSVAEGFGMTFLEPWLAGLPVFGRDLPAITADFKRSGLRLDRLYDRLSIPLEWVGADRFADALRTAGEALLAAYRRPDLPMREWLALFAAKTTGDSIDFGDLDEELQEVVLRRVLSDKASRAELRSLNPLASPPASEPELVTSNAERVRSAYSPAAIGVRIQSIYEALERSPIGELGELRASAELLDRLLDLRHFRLIRGIV